MFFLLLIAAATVAIASSRGGKATTMVFLNATPIPMSPNERGELEKDVPAGPGFQGRINVDGSTLGLGPRDVVVGPLLAGIPKGSRLICEATLTIAAKPAAMPGAPPTPCYAVGSYLVFNSDRELVRNDEENDPECGELSLTSGPPGRYTPRTEVPFPDFRLVRRSNGIYFAYTWIRWRSAADDERWLSYAHTLQLTWELTK